MDAQKALRLAGLAQPLGPDFKSKYESAKAVLADREAELLELKGPCSNSGCRLHYAHRGPCDMRGARS